MIKYTVSPGLSQVTGNHLQKVGDLPGLRLERGFFGRTGEAISFFRNPGNFDQQVVAIRFSSPEEWGFVSKLTHSIKPIKLEPNGSQPD
jgi:hypothetical protein